VGDALHGVAVDIHGLEIGDVAVLTIRVTVVVPAHGFVADIRVGDGFGDLVGGHLGQLVQGRQPGVARIADGATGISHDGVVDVGPVAKAVVPAEGPMVAVEV